VPCEDLPSRKLRAWKETTTQAPPVVAVVAALMTGLVALLFGQSPLSSIVSAALVGAGTFIALYVWHWFRAPGEINAERERRLREWRARYMDRVNVGGPNRDTLEIMLLAPTGQELEGFWCVIEHESGKRFESRKPTKQGMVFGPPSPFVEWDFPQAFGSDAVIEEGRYTCTFLMGSHAEPLNSREVTMFRSP
jgi:hypothetical protein